MGVSWTVKCTKCGRRAQELGEDGMMGFPSLSVDQGPPPKGPRVFAPVSFGYIYEGFRRIALLTRPLDAYLLFLYAHVGHDVEVLCDFEDAFADSRATTWFRDGRHARNGPPKPERSMAYVDAHFRVECARCSQAVESQLNEPIRVSPPRVLGKADISDFLERVIEPEDSVHGSEPFGYYDLQDLAHFLKKHRTHAPTLTQVSCGQTTHPHT